MTSAAAPREVYVTPAILAEQMGWSERKARRVMCEIEIEHPGVVMRRREGRGRGLKLYAHASRIAPYIRGMRETPLERETRLLRSRVSELEQRLDAETEESIRFRALSHQWFARVRALENSARAKNGNGA